MPDVQQVLLTLGSVAGAIMAVIGLGKVALSPIAKQLKENKSDNSAIKTGINVLLRKELEEECDRVSGKGYLTTVEVQSITDIYDAYHKLGGNGSGTAIYTRVMRLGDWRNE